MKRDERGTMTLWVLGLCIAVLFLGGLSLDLWRVIAVRRSLVAMADAGATAGANGLDTGALRNGQLVLDPGAARSAAGDALREQSGWSHVEAADIEVTDARITVTLRARVDFTLLGILVHGDPVKVDATASAEPRGTLIRRRGERGGRLFGMTVLATLEHPIVLAPMAGGPSTTAMTAAVSNAGGLGFVAAGYLTVDALQAEIDAVRAKTDRPFGVNVFSPVAPGDPAAVERFAELLRPLATANGVALGEARHDDDHYAEKIELLLHAPPAVVSFAFGCPKVETVEQLKAAGCELWVTVTNADEARVAADVGADAVVAQGSEAGAHRGSFVDDDREPQPLLELVRDVRAALDGMAGPPMIVATGGVMTGAHIGRALDAGAAAAQLGTAFMLCPEAGTHPVHRVALAEPHATVVTRAFTGRRARGIVNAWTERFDSDAPSAYPEVHHLTAPLRAHGRRVGDRDLFNLWAGEGHALARALPAAELVALLAAEVESAPRGD